MIEAKMGEGTKVDLRLSDEDGLEQGLDFEETIGLQLCVVMKSYLRSCVENYEKAHSEDEDVHTGAAYYAFSHLVATFGAVATGLMRDRCTEGVVALTTACQCIVEKEGQLLGRIEANKSGAFEASDIPAAFGAKVGNFTRRDN